MAPKDPPPAIPRWEGRIFVGLNVVACALNAANHHPLWAVFSGICAIFIFWSLEG